VQLEAPSAPPMPVSNLPALKGRVTVAGAGDLRRITVYNSSNHDWHDCDVRLPNNKHYLLGDLEEGDSEGIMFFRFEYDGVPKMAPLNQVFVICTEGVGQFNVSL
jgi:hypothetical protein